MDAFICQNSTVNISAFQYMYILLNLKKELKKLSEGGLNRLM